MPSFNELSRFSLLVLSRNGHNTRGVGTVPRSDYKQHISMSSWGQLKASVPSPLERMSLNNAPEILGGYSE